MPDPIVSSPYGPSQRVIRAAGIAVWPVVAVFYASGLLWLLLRYSRCQVDDAIETICDTGIGMPAFLQIVVIAMFTLVVFHLHKVGREIEYTSGRNRGRLARSSSARVQRGYRSMSPTHRMHVHNSLRANVYLLGGTGAFLAFWFRWGHLEAGAWLVQLAFVFGAELLVWWAKSLSDDETR